MIQEQFQHLAKDILLNARVKLSTTYLHETRMSILQNMGNQLEALRKSYGQMSGQELDMPKFRELMQITE